MPFTLAMLLPVPNTKEGLILKVEPQDLRPGQVAFHVPRESFELPGPSPSGHRTDPDSLLQFSDSKHESPSCTGSFSE